MNHEEYMMEAYKEAKKSYEKGEVPVGAIIVYKDEIIGRGHNKRENLRSPLAHGEIMAIDEASKKLNRWRLEETSIYVTLEPCIMCTGAIINSRIGKVYIGARDYKRGCCGTRINLFKSDISNHQPRVKFGVLAGQCQALLEEFFEELRAGKIKKFQ